MFRSRKIRAYSRKPPSLAECQIGLSCHSQCYEIKPLFGLAFCAWEIYVICLVASGKKKHLQANPR
jgi:hypothetical protein